MSTHSDVCLLLEGTYPYITGGVSSWVHQLLRALPHLRFSLVSIMPDRSFVRNQAYQLPENVVSLSHIFIHDGLVPTARSWRADAEADYRQLVQAAERIMAGDLDAFRAIVELFCGRPPRISAEHFLYSRPAWELLRETAARHTLHTSFIDFFWTWRFSLLPAIKLLSAPMPHARIYHSISTGYAGLAATAATIRHSGSSLLLTEHGIYTEERRLEIASAEWIYDELASSSTIGRDTCFFREWWTGLFNILSRLCYHHADQITTLFNGNRELQIRNGADPRRCLVIPNGIDTSRFPRPAHRVPDSSRCTVALIGRVVPIKDVKNFIAAAAIVRRALPGATFLVVGPTDEDEDYYGDCLLMRRLLQLEEVLSFTGKADVHALYPSIDVLVLSSVSEAMPLVILEAYAYQIPVVSTDVGACREMILGRDEEPEPAGVVVGIADPQALADGIIKLITEPAFHTACGITGRRRLEESYRAQEVFAAYSNLYEGFL